MGKRPAGGFENDEPLCLHSLNANGDSKLLATHVTRGRWNEGAVDSTVATSAIDQFFHTGIVFIGYENDADIGRIILREQSVKQVVEPRSIAQNRNNDGERRTIFRIVGLKWRDQLSNLTGAGKGIAKTTHKGKQQKNDTACKSNGVDGNGKHDGCGINVGNQN